MTDWIHKVEGEPDPDKYVVFKRDDFESVATEDIQKLMLNFALPDAVVIRRQDYFAYPALNAYASCIAIAARMMDNDPVRQQELMAISDYFHQQAELSGDEAWKLPDL